MDQHEPLYYATYQGESPVVFVGEGRLRRGYTLGSQTQVGADDAERIAESELRDDFLVEQVPVEIVGTAEEAQPFDAAAAIARNLMLHKLDNA